MKLLDTLLSRSTPKRVNYIFWFFLTGKAKPEPEVSESGKSFTRKKPSDKLRNELGQVVMEITLTEGGT